MNRYILILFLITTHLFASSQVYSIKAKAKQVNNIIKAKFLVRGDFEVPLEEDNNYFITRITANIDGNIVYDIALSHIYQSGRFMNFVLKFNFLYEGRGDNCHHYGI